MYLYSNNFSPICTYMYYTLILVGWKTDKDKNRENGSVWYQVIQGESQETQN